MAEKILSLTNKEKTFIQIVWNHYQTAGRHALPWRKTTNPYRILVSEVMLQQTQVSRVLIKYKEFLSLFPNTERLAAASLGEVLRAWQGLGYNRRAKFLWQAAQVVASERRGKWPKTFSELKTLPGIGEYTAGAVVNFAYNEPVPLIETNVRTVYIHHFFKNKTEVTDTELLRLVARTIDQGNPREWNWALMDYGSYLKSTVGNLNKRSRTYKKQSDFKTSNRYVRGAILRSLAAQPKTQTGLMKTFSDIETGTLLSQIAALLKEGLILRKGKYYMLP